MLLVCQRRGTVQLGSSNAGLLPKPERLQSVNQHAGRQDQVSKCDNIALTHKIPKCASRYNTTTVKYRNCTTLKQYNITTVKHNCTTLILYIIVQTALLFGLAPIAGWKMYPKVGQVKKILEEKGDQRRIIQVLDGIGPVDNRPSTNKLHHFVQKKKKKRDM